MPQANAAADISSNVSDGASVAPGDLPMEIERLRALAAYVDRELGYEWQRKSSLETRGFAIVTANLAFITLFLAISAQLELLDNLSERSMRWLLLAALILVALSTALAVLATVPRNYPTPEATALEELLQSILDDDVSIGQTTQEIAEVSIAQLRAATEANDFKARLSVGAFIALAAATVALAAALISAVLTSSL